MVLIAQQTEVLPCHKRDIEETFCLTELFGHEHGMTMKNKKAKTSGHRVFPRVDRSIVTVGSALDKSDEKAFWLSKTPLDRLEAVELLRQIAYGYDPTTTRLQRVLEIAEFPPR